ncbi:hypothetical protein AB0L75_05230 [Streptomyces sp. NPDC052101]|uniref:hypothetical protein n=1 Tax=Streptomyces sp. NPDC052101 TaxID=3155763 RepID=UPI003443EB26
MASFNIDRNAIEKMQRELAKEFERAARKHPIRVPVEAAIDESLSVQANAGMAGCCPTSPPGSQSCTTRSRTHRARG